MKAQPKHVDGRLQQMRRRAGEERCDARIGGNEVPVKVDGEGGIGLVGGEHLVDRLTGGGNSAGQG